MEKEGEGSLKKTLKRTLITLSNLTALIGMINRDD